MVYLGIKCISLSIPKRQNGLAGRLSANGARHDNDGTASELDSVSYGIRSKPARQFLTSASIRAAEARRREPHLSNRLPMSWSYSVGHHKRRLSHCARRLGSEWVYTGIFSWDSESKL
jgi:hypothetical protein